MQMMRTRASVQMQQQQIQTYTLSPEDQQRLSQHLQVVKTEQQELERVEPSQLSSAQLQRLKVMSVLVSQIPTILERCKQSRGINETQWNVIARTVHLSQEIQKEKQLKAQEHISQQLAAISDKLEIGVSASAASASQRPHNKSSTVSSTSLVSAAGADNPPSEPDDGGNDDPFKPSKPEPRSRWTVLKDNVSRYFTNGAFLWDLAVGAAIGGLLAIGTPVAVVTIPTAYTLLATARIVNLACLLVCDPNGDYMNQRYASWNNR